MKREEYPSLSGPTTLQGFLEAAPDAIVVVDEHGRVVIANGLTERMFGFAREELIGNSSRRSRKVALRSKAGAFAKMARIFGPTS